MMPAAIEISRQLGDRPLTGKCAPQCAYRFTARELRRAIFPERERA